MQFIQKIEIRNFRSILLIKAFDVSDLNIFVGNNDNGKSNIIRALNLFFNNKTDYDKDFRFLQDYSYHSIQDSKPKEIKIELTIAPPKDRFKDSRIIKWSKKWKSDGSIQEERVYLENNDTLPSSENVYKWLDKIKFRYIPAIKSEKYFFNLMEELYDVLNSKFEKEIAEKGLDFIEGLQKITENITNNLNLSLGIPNSLQIPSDFKQLFSRLDFGMRSNNKIYHLSQRGDGIKVRHIPVILHHMAIEEQSHRGFVKSDTIWGFEEPENNLELKFCFDLAKKFTEYSKDIQIFITTHSPAFYQLNNHVNVYTYYVTKENNTTNIKILDTNIDNEMGLLPLIAPYIEKIYHQEKVIKDLKSDINLLKDNIQYVILTEDSDTKFLESYLNIQGLNKDEMELISYGNCSQLKTSAFSLAKYIKNKKQSIKVAIHRDRDYLDENEIIEIKASIEKIQCFPFITNGTDIESLFVNKEHINELYPEIPLQTIDNFIEMAINESDEDSVQRLIDQYFKDNRHNPADGTYKLTKKLEDKYRKNKHLYFYGKKTYNLLKNKIQKHIKSNPDLLRPSTAIINNDLQKFFNIETNLKTKQSQKNRTSPSKNGKQIQSLLNYKNQRTSRNR